MFQNFGTGVYELAGGINTNYIGIYKWRSLTNLANCPRLGRCHFALKSI